jgi:hypothetical protein
MKHTNTCIWNTYRKTSQNYCKNIRNIQIKCLQHPDKHTCNICFVCFICPQTYVASIACRCFKSRLGEGADNRCNDRQCAVGMRRMKAPQGVGWVDNHMWGAFFLKRACLDGRMSWFCHYCRNFVAINIFTSGILRGLSKPFFKKNSWHLHFAN